MAQPGPQRGLMAEVAAEGDVAHERMLRGQRSDFGNRGIGRAVVDEDDLEAAEPPRDLGEPFGHACDVLRLIVGGQDQTTDRASWHPWAARPMMPQPTRPTRRRAASWSRILARRRSHQRRVGGSTGEPRRLYRSVNGVHIAAALPHCLVHKRGGARVAIGFADLLHVPLDCLSRGDGPARTAGGAPTVPLEISELAAE